MFALLAVAFGLVYRGTHVFHVAFGGLFVLAAHDGFSLNASVVCGVHQRAPSTDQVS